MKIFDITIPLSEETPAWEGERGVTVTQSALKGEGSDYNISRYELSVHSGTHIDAPYHVLTDGMGVDSIPLGKLIGPVQVIEIPDGISIITDDVLREMQIMRNASRILLKTSNSKLWDIIPAVFTSDYAGIDTSGATYILSSGIGLVGIDYFSISHYTDLLHPHELLLGSNVVILENLDLRDIEPGTYVLYCLPLKLTGTDGAPARVILTQGK